jgi:hypothetical protein
MSDNQATLRLGDNQDGWEEACMEGKEVPFVQVVGMGEDGLPAPLQCDASGRMALSNNDYEVLIGIYDTLNAMLSRTGFTDSGGRLRIALDAITASLTLATITTVTTVTTVTAMTSMHHLGASAGAANSASGISAAQAGMSMSDQPALDLANHFIKITN